jgi:hypothetical protein
MTRYGDIARLINGLRTSHSFIRLHRTFYFPLRGESRDVLAVPVVKPVCISVALSHTGLRAQSAPGFPCALFGKRDNEIARLGRKRVAGMRLLGCLKSRIRKLTVVPDKRAERARSGIHNHRTSFCEGCRSSSLLQHDLVVMGPCVRRDDAEYCARSALTSSPAPENAAAARRRAARKPPADRRSSISIRRVGCGRR